MQKNITFLFFLFKFHLKRIGLWFLYFLMFPARMLDRRKWVVIFRTDHLGDVLCSVSVFRHFARYCDARNLALAIFVDSPYQGLLERLVPGAKVIALSETKALHCFSYRLRIFGLLYSMRIQKTVSFLVFGKLNFLEVFSFAKEKHRTYINLPPSDANISLKYYAKYFNCHHEIFRGLCIHDQLERIFEEITGEQTSYELPDFRTDLPDVILPDPLPGKYYLILPGSSMHFRCWSPAKFAVLLQLIRMNFPEYTAVILGSKADRALEEKLMEQIDDKTGILALCGKTDLKTLFAWMRGASFVIGNDSGGIHLAAGYRIPFFAIFDCADFGRYLPNPYYPDAHYFCHEWSCASCFCNCIYQDSDSTRQWPCLRSIEVEEVYPAIQSFLRGMKKAVTEERKSCRKAV